MVGAEHHRVAFAAADTRASSTIRQQPIEQIEPMDAVPRHGFLHVIRLVTPVVILDVPSTAGLAVDLQAAARALLEIEPRHAQALATSPARPVHANKCSDEASCRASRGASRETQEASWRRHNFRRPRWG